MAMYGILPKEGAEGRYFALKFALWAGMVSISMMFGAFTSAYLVRKPAGNWYEFKLPTAFLFSTIVLLISSVCLEWTYRSFKNGNEKPYKAGIFLSLVTGVIFIALQVLGWKSMFAQGIAINLNVSGSFLYVISGFHALHVLGGIAALLVSCLFAFSMPFLNSARRILRLDLVRQYWHFVDVLWIYLMLFLILQ